jgi:hypothetical protein
MTSCSRVLQSVIVRRVASEFIVQLRARRHTSYVASCRRKISNLANDNQPPVRMTIPHEAGAVSHRLK